ncbi:MAG TPA: cache domain-containing protein [Patescibacteria group bacterium]|nr:cache domain-containing protein [Patescibacteria group bacterium]
MTLAPAQTESTFVPDSGSPCRPQDLRQSPWSAHRVALAVIIGLLACVLLHLKITYDKAMRDAETLVSALANASEQHIGSSLNALDNLLEELSATVQAGRQTNIRFANDFFARLASYPEIRFVGIVNAQGILQPGTWPIVPMADGGLDVSDRKYFTAQRQAKGPAQMIIGETVIGRANGERTFHLSRPIRDAAGNFAGVVVAAVNPDYYATFLASILYDDAGSCGLIGTDGQIIARAPDHVQTFGRDISNSDLLSAWRLHGPVGVVHLTAKTDGNDKLLAYRVLPDFALMVTAGISRNKALAGWWRMATIEMTLLSGFSIMLLYWVTRIGNDGKVLEREQRKLEDTVQLRSRELAEARTLAERRAVQLDWINEEIKRLALVAAHHLQEPLRSIVSYSQMIRRSLPQRSADLDAMIDTLCQEGAGMKAHLGEFEAQVSILTDSFKASDAPVVESDHAPAVGRPSFDYMARAIAVTVILAMLAGTALQLQTAHDNAILAAENVTGAVVKSIEYHLRGSIRRIDNLLNEVVLAVEDNRHTTLEFRDRVLSRIATMPEIFHIAIADDTGLVSPHTWPERGLPEQGLDISDREYFRSQMRAIEPGRLVVGLPRIGRVAGERSIQFSHPLLGPTGKFAGIAFASINPDVYARYLETTLLDEGGASAVLSLDGHILARAPNHIEKFGIDISDSDLFRLWIPRSLSGVAQLVSKADGNDKLVGYRVFSGFPLVVTSGISRANALRDWYWIAGFETLIALFAAAILFHWARRADFYAKALRDYRQSLSAMVAERTAGMTAAHLAATHRAAHLGEVNAKLQRLTHMIAADLQAPLRLLGSHIEALHHMVPGDDGECALWLSFIGAGGTHLQALLRDFQRFVIVFSETPTMEPLDSGEVAGAAADMIRTILNGQEVSFDIVPLPRVMADRDMVMEVFLQLFSNAIIHHKGPQAVQVRVSAERRGRQCVFSVSDNGPGLAPQLGERVFQAFEPMHNRDPNSTGLGLPLCRIIVQSHGGHIWIEPSGTGATVCFSLPEIAG